MTIAPATPRPARVYNAEQLAIVDAVRTGVSVKIKGFAGAAKTTELELIAEANAPAKMLYLAYNTTMAAEARVRFRRFAGHVVVSTMHALAFAAVGRDLVGHQSQSRLEARPFAIRQAIEQHFTADLMRLSSNIQKAASAVLTTITTYQNSVDLTITTSHVPDEPKVSAPQSAVAELASRVFTAMTEPGDFPLTHDTYLKYYQAVQPPRLDEIYKLIAVDEAQDANPVMLAIVNDQQCQKVFVGDSHQSLYGFRAAIDAIESLPLDEYALTQSWRFGNTIARFANEVLAVKGETRILRGNPAVEDAVVMTSKEKPDAILARTNAGVFEEALRLVDTGGRVSILGGVDELLSMVLGAYELNLNGRSTHSAFRFFRSWDDLEEAARGPQGAEYGPFVRIVERHGDQLPNECARIRNSVGGDGATVLGTTHKAKGLEWPHVRAAADFMPFCLYDSKRKQYVFRDDEANIFYVMMTRAERLLELRGFMPILMTSLRSAERMGRTRFIVPTPDDVTPTQTEPAPQLTENASAT